MLAQALGHLHPYSFVKTVEMHYLSGRTLPKSPYNQQPLQNSEKRTAKHKPYPMICLEIVNILSKNERPKVFAQKLDDIQRSEKSRSGDGKSKLSAKLVLAANPLREDMS